MILIFSVKRFTALTCLDDNSLPGLISSFTLGNHCAEHKVVQQSEFYSSFLQLCVLISGMQALTSLPTFLWPIRALLS